MIGPRKGDYERLSAMKCSLSLQRILSSVFDSNLGTYEPKMGVITLGHVLASTVKGPTLLTVTLQLGIWLSLDCFLVHYGNIQNQTQNLIRIEKKKKYIYYVFSPL